MGPDDMDTLALDLEMLGYTQLRVFKTSNGWQASVRTPDDAWAVGVALGFCEAVGALWGQISRRSR